MEIILLTTVIFAMIITLISLPGWIKRAKQCGISGKDMNKPGSLEEVAEAGGICPLVGFIFGVLVYIAIKTFYIQAPEFVLEIFALLVIFLIAGFMGFADDILGWKIGLTKTMRLILLAFASLPLLVINASNIGGNPTSLGFVYPLILIILGVVGASSTFNFLAGWNGLETSQGILIISALSLVAYLTGNAWLAIIGFILTGSLLVFYLFNKYPAKVFPGNVLTYPVGAFIAVMAILGHMELIAIFFFLPYILETILKARGKLKKESFGKPNSDWSMDMPYDKIYGLEHLAILILKKVKPSKKVYEKDVVYLINSFQILIILIGFIIFKVKIF